MSHLGPAVDILLAPNTRNAVPRSIVNSGEFPTTIMKQVVIEKEFPKS